MVLNLFYFTRKTSSIYNFRYMVECYKKRVNEIRNNIGAYESVRKLVAFSSDVVVDIVYYKAVYRGCKIMHPIALARV